MVLSLIYRVEVVQSMQVTSNYKLELCLWVVFEKAVTLSVFSIRMLRLVSSECNIIKKNANKLVHQLRCDMGAI